MDPLINAVQRSVTEAHEGGEYERLIQSRLDTYFAPEKLKWLFDNLAGVHDATIDIEQLDFPGQRSHKVYVGLRGSPSWHVFNRVLDADRRDAAIKNRHPKPLDYLIIRVSRLGPFWTGAWNRFSWSGTGIQVDATPRPADLRWNGVEAAVQEVFRSQGIREIHPHLLFEAAHGIRTKLAPTLRRRGKDPRPTFFDCLFEDIA